MSEVETVKLFLSWPRDVRELCVAMHGLVAPVVEPKPLIRRNEDGQPWTQERLLEAFTHFETHGVNRNSCRKLAKLTGRTIASIETCRDQRYKVWIKGDKK